MIGPFENNVIERAIKASVLAGVEILKVYASGDAQIWTKDDKSPLTEADIKSNDKIVAELTDLGIPILSEESKQDEYSVRKDWDKLWLIDPLDGTKEFIKRNGEFTVNIALVESTKSVAGVIFVPVLGDLYVGEQGVGAYKTTLGSNWIDRDVDELLATVKWVRLDAACSNSKTTLVVSKSHYSDETKKFVDDVESIFGECDAVSAGSSLKLCLVASAKAHIYPRFAPTMEWDTAAGHALLKAMGGNVLEYPSMKEMTYNREDLLNKWFIGVDGGSHANEVLSKTLN